MKQVFADAVYWIAIANPRDSWRAAALRARAELGSVMIVTTDEVLTEFLAALSKGGPNLRQVAVKMVIAIMSNENVRVIAQSRDSFNGGLARYQARIDKNYSLQDCVSMNAMESESITEILTHDHHFEQEGFRLLIQKP